LQRGVLAMAISPDDFAAYQVAIQPVKLSLTPPKEPVWALIPAVALQKLAVQKIDALPAAAKAYVPALQGAQQIMLSIGADPASQLKFGLQVTCKDATAASVLLTQLEAATSALREVLSKVKHKPDPADFSGVLVAGTFHRTERQVYGTWPIPRAFVDAIAGAY
jgi:hypothetical protein